MATFSTMQMALSGIRAQARAMEDISGNIANVRTTAFKRFNTSFAEMVSAAGSAGGAVAAGVTTQSRPSSLVVGEIQSTGNKTSMALNGEGFFPVQTASGEPAFSRRGDFSLADAPDDKLYLANSAGMLLKEKHNNPNKPDKETELPPIVIDPKKEQQGTPTSEIEYELNLPAIPKTSQYDQGVPGSELLSADLNKNITPADVRPFLQQTLSGGTLPVHDTGGGKLDLEFRWGKLSGPPDADKWALFYLRDQGAAEGQPMWSKAGEYEFTDNQLSALRDGAGAQSPLDSLLIQDLTVKGEAIGPVRLLHGPAGVTQFADARGRPVPTTLTQNGYAPGKHTGVSIGPEGQVVQTFSNGRSEQVATIQLYNFANPEGLERGDGGELLYNASAGRAVEISAADLVISAVEGSNIDLPHEFSMLILTQQAYSASTRMISAADEMMKGALDEMR